MLEVEERVNHLDELMAQLIQTVDRTSREMREFKQEMRQSRESSKQEMQEFREEMHQLYERSEERSKREMEDFKAEMRQSKRDLDKKWGELSNKLGTMAEDLVAPSIPRIFKQITGCTTEIKYSAVRVRKSEPQNQEFDVVAVCGNYVFINETKSTLRVEHIDNFYRLLQKIREYFPEFQEKQFIGAIASLYVDDTLVRYGEKLGLIVLGFGEELMDVLNSPEFSPTLFEFSQSIN